MLPRLRLLPGLLLAWLWLIAGLLLTAGLWLLRIARRIFIRWLSTSRLLASSLLPLRLLALRLLITAGLLSGLRLLPGGWLSRRWIGGIGLGRWILILTWIAPLRILLWLLIGLLTRLLRWLPLGILLRLILTLRILTRLWLIGTFLSRLLPRLFARLL